MNPTADLARAILRGALAQRRGADVDVDYRTRPIDWMVDRLGVDRASLVWSANPGYEVHQWDGDVDPFVKAAEGLADGLDVGIESGTGTGKTFWLGGIALWFLSCWRDSLVVTAAPKEKQLELHLWKEIHRFWPRFETRWPTARKLHLQVRMPGAQGEWGAVGFASGVGAAEESATKAQGFHAEHMLIITEETPGIDLAIMTAFANTATGSHNLRLAVGNPDHHHDPLHRFCLEPGVVHVRVSALDHPNVALGADLVPGATTRASVERRRLKWTVSSRLYRSRVRGISPAESVDALIRLDWITAARERGKAGHPDRAALLAVGGPALGVDVANSENGDQAAIARGRGAVCLEVEAFPCPDASKLGVRVAAEMRQAKVADVHVGIDSVGVGASTVNKLLELNRPVESLNGGEKPKGVGADRGTEEEEFLNLRAQMWWQARVDLQHGLVALPDDDELEADLLMAEWTTRGGNIVVEEKDKIRKRLGRSPNKGDAFVYWNWVRPRPALFEPAADVTPPHHERVHQRTQRLLEQARRRQNRELGMEPELDAIDLDGEAHEDVLSDFVG